MEQGIILKGVGGKYEVQTERGRLSCTLRGRLRLEDKRILVGDKVEVTRQGQSGVVERILPRRTELERPPIANVDQAVVVFAVEEPAPNLLLLDRILVQAELAGLSAAVIFNKCDLDCRRAEELKNMYEGISYLTLAASAKEGWGLEPLADLLQNRITTLAGPSGTGKSSLLNALIPGLGLETQALSARLQRGRHTTRSVELLSLPQGGYAADTPGFSQLKIAPGLAAELQYAFPEMRKYLNSCQFRGCLHRREPNCAVKTAVQSGAILPHRYEHYLLLLEEAEIPPRY